jgi:hypothetical protein
LSSIGVECANFESPPCGLSDAQAEAHSYLTFSARYGNIYTVASLRQLIDEAFGVRDPILKIVKNNLTDKYIDLMRPSVGPGFDEYEEALKDRLKHLVAVKQLFLESSIFIFTLGLTEAWVEPCDGSEITYGSHPNVLKGINLNNKIISKNYDYSEIWTDLLYIKNFLNDKNSKLKFILTVSPVALAATHQRKNVLIATSYSKSVLRAICGRFSDLHEDIEYFMSFEIFNSPQSFGQYLDGTLRDVSNRGVSVAMKVFHNMFIEQSYSNKDFMESESKSPECDEILNSFINNQEKNKG